MIHITILTKTQKPNTQNNSTPQTNTFTLLIPETQQNSNNPITINELKIALFLQFPGSPSVEDQKIFHNDSLLPNSAQINHYFIEKTIKSAIFTLSLIGKSLKNQKILQKNHIFGSQFLKYNNSIAFSDDFQRENVILTQNLEEIPNSEYIFASKNTTIQDLTASSSLSNNSNTTENERNRNNNPNMNNRNRIAQEINERNVNPDRLNPENDPNRVILALNPIIIMKLAVFVLLFSQGKPIFSKHVLFLIVFSISYFLFYSQILLWIFKFFFPRIFCVLRRHFRRLFENQRNLGNNENNVREENDSEENTNGQLQRRRNLGRVAGFERAFFGFFISLFPMWQHERVE